MNVGGWFQIRGQKHWANGEKHCVIKTRRETAKGNPDVPVLDLGIMVTFEITDFHGNPGQHAVPIEWCSPCERPNVAKRVKAAAFSESAKPEFWSDMYAACREQQK